MMQKLTFDKFVVVAIVSVFLASCNSSETEVPGYDDFESFVTRNKVGSDPDQWIEMKNMSGEWEKTGLIFGYTDDYEECQTVIAGMKAKNYLREYRCVPANAQ